ncbi:hypothetical protein BDA96_08G184400 [Sorghum bicolor]|uniref:Protein kinase domain-containing protein n=2 Tax=Sorghum bicolor TaxID=4558 RepID=A0A921U8P2_SORBI|nr:hypothetical protein BDA96_08G184400 [Sorghum bicolor]OQU79589.1 hypothetical protein SORBI_3008G166900 [Sorghum bicolor]
MPDVEDSSSSPLVDPSQRCCNAWTRILLHVVMVTTLFSVIMFAYIYLCVVRHYAVASLVIQLIAYPALGCLYIYNSSSRQDKFLSAGYLVLVMSVFLISSFGLKSNGNTYRIEFVSLANMVAISSYCVWKCSFILHYYRLKKLVRTILHGAVVATLLVVIISAYGLYRRQLYGGFLFFSSVKESLLIQLVAYNAVAILYIGNSSGPKEKVISAGLLVLVLFVFLFCSFLANTYRTDLIFGANIVAISSHCAWKLYPQIRPWLDALDAHTEPSQPARQQEAVLRLQQTPFCIKDLPKEFSSDEIQSITQDFGKRIGHGASAQVFHGSLDDGTAIAVKRIHMHSGHTEAGEEEFRREVSIIANVHHRSLVRLLGYCLQQHGGGGLYLVYPFFENASLDRWIFSRSDEQRRLLAWPKRFCIAVDVARALAYLHKDCHRRILHLDVKPGNILLDGDLRGHVSDFGISLSITRDLTSVINTRGRGTFGYMAPEMLVNAVSDRSDVFSYGMTLLELIGGRRNFDPSSSATLDPNLAQNLREKMAQDKHMELVDIAMADVDEEAVKTVVKVALLCIQHERDMRPSMQNVVDMLEGRVAVNLPPEARRPSSSSAVNLSEPHSVSEHAIIDMQVA